MKPGKFITLEGCEGVGKSTNINFIQQYLQEQGLNVVVTREPGGTQLAEQIRNLLLKSDIEEKMPYQAELLLMFAGRSLHIENVIKPNLLQGHWVLCDRFTDASYAYQGGGRGLSLEHIAWLERFTQGELQPNLTLLLDMPAAEGLERAHKRSAPDRFEAEKTVFFEAVRAAYLERASFFPERIKIIQADLDLNLVQEQIKLQLEVLIAN